VVTGGSFFPKRQGIWGVKFTTHVHLVLWLRMGAVMSPLLLCLHGRHKGQTLPFFTPDGENRSTFWNAVCSDLKMMENVQNNMKV